MFRHIILVINTTSHSVLEVGLSNTAACWWSHQSALCTPPTGAQLPNHNLHCPIWAHQGVVGQTIIYTIRKRYRASFFYDYRRSIYPINHDQPRLHAKQQSSLVRLSIDSSSMPTRGAISRVIVNLALFPDKYVQNSYHPLNLIGSFRTLSLGRYIWFLIKDLILFSQRR